MRPSDAQDMPEEQPAEKLFETQGISTAFAQIDDAEPPRVPVTSELASYIRAAAKPPPPPMGDTATIASSILSQQYQATLAQLPTHVKVDEHLDRQRVHQARLAGILAGKSNATLSPIMSKEQVTRLAHHVTIRRNLLQHMCRMLHAQELDAAQYDAKASLLFAADEMVDSPKMGEDLMSTSYTTTTSPFLYRSTSSATSATSYPSTSSTPPPEAESIVMTDETKLMRMSEAEAARQRALAEALAALPVLPAPASHDQFNDQFFGDIHSFDELTPGDVTSSAAKVILQELEELGIEALAIEELGVEEAAWDPSISTGLSSSGIQIQEPFGILT
jgi:hypothetical protein